MESENEKGFEIYLSKLSYSNQTIKSYLYSVKVFMSLNEGADNFQYKDILNYFEQNPNQVNKGGSKIKDLAAIKKYYDYLIEMGKRKKHPCRNFFFRGVKIKGVIYSDLFSSEELEQLLNRNERYNILTIRNQLIISLLIYQGLTSGEIQNMKLSHVHFDEGKIYIKESRNLHRRYLEILPKQYRLFDKYINEIRPQLLRSETPFLFLGKLGSTLTVDGLNYIVTTYKMLFPERDLNPQTIRQSVIANWLNERNIPLEQVQLLAGHKWISSTAEYRHISIEEQRTLINKLHPLE